MHGDFVKPAYVDSEHWKQATTFADAAVLHELNGCLDIRA
jgi:hypothetical protein